MPVSGNLRRKRMADLQPFNPLDAAIAEWLEAKTNKSHSARTAKSYRDTMADFRAASADIKFNAPTPWIYGATGGKGRSSGDGYYILLEPLPPGDYDISYGGVFGGPPALTQTYRLTVSAHGDCDRD